MRRREVVGAFLAVPLLASFVARVSAQPSRRRPLVGWLGFKSAENSPLKRDFADGMKQRGLLVGRDYALLERFARNHGGLDALAAEIVREQPDVIVAPSTAAVAAARRATKDIPIVGCALTDPVALGFIKSHARPGTNVTGVLSTTEELAGKQLSLAVELLGGAPVIGLLSNAANPGSASQVSGAIAAAAALSLPITRAEAGSPAEFDAAFDALRHAGARMVNVIGDAIFVNESSALAASALNARLPTMYNAREHVRAGGLMSYGISLAANFRRAAVFVDRIIRGETPANLPVELPPTYELAVNLVTAKLLSLDVPSAILARADEVIE